MADAPRTFEAFWLFYVSQHRHPTCRRLHVVGTSLVLVMGALGALHSPWWLLAAPLVGYGPAWIGHFAFEKNRPATFTHAGWSLRADFRMVWYTLTGRMPAELKKADEAYATRGHD